MKNSLDIYLNGRMVGCLHKASNGAISFKYDETWLNWEHTFPISISLPLQEQQFIGDVVSSFFDNLLPDNKDIRDKVASKVGAVGTDAFSLLYKIGRDCVGALQFVPQGLTINAGESGAVAGRRLSDTEIAKKINNLSNSPLGISDEDDAFRISIAGAQEKTALLTFEDSGWLLPYDGTPTTHIFKPQIGMLTNGIDLSQSVENEHLCMTFFSKMGLETAKTEILDFDGVRVLSVERFDRKWIRSPKNDGNTRLLRLPQEDFCQALNIPPSKKYETSIDGSGPGIKTCMDFLKASDTPDKDRRTFFKAQILFWLLGATDGHAKNFSIFLSQGGRFHMTPLYDIMSAFPNLDAGQIRHNKMKMAMAVGSNRHYPVLKICPRHFEQTAALCGFPQSELKSIWEEIINKALPAMTEALEEMPCDFPDNIGLSISTNLKKQITHLENIDNNEYSKFTLIAD